MCLDYWSADNERWFAARLRQIKEGNGQPFTASEWRTKLAKKTPHKSNVRRNARSFAKGTLPPANDVSV